MLTYILLSLLSWKVAGMDRRNWEYINDFGLIGITGGHPQGYCIDFEENYGEVTTPTWPAALKKNGCEKRFYGKYSLKFVRDLSDDPHCAEYSMRTGAKSDDSAIWCAQYQLKAADMPFSKEWCLSWKYAPPKSTPEAWKKTQYELKECDTNDQTQIMTVFKGVATLNQPANRNSLNGPFYVPSLRSINYSEGEEYKDDTWVAFWSQPKQQETPLVIQGFAALGLAVVLYGSYKHYSGTKN